MSVSSVIASIEGFVKKEIKGAETIIAKAEAIEKAVAPQIKALMPELVSLYNAAKAAIPQVEADIQAIAIIIAEVEAL
jgi:hypothetical protein